MSSLMSLYGPTVDAVDLLDADLRSSEARPALDRDLVSLDLQLSLRNSCRMNAWRARMGLPLRANKEDVRKWHYLLELRRWLAAHGRRRRSHNPTTPQAA